MLDGHHWRRRILHCTRKNEGSRYAGEKDYFVDCLVVWKCLPREHRIRLELDARSGQARIHVLLTDLVRIISLQSEPNKLSICETNVYLRA